MSYRYFGRRQNAGHGWPWWWRARRSLARKLARVPVLWRLGYLVDVNRDRHSR